MSDHFFALFLLVSGLLVSFSLCVLLDWHFLRYIPAPASFA